MDKTVQLGLQVWDKFIEEILQKHIQSKSSQDWKIQR